MGSGFSQTPFSGYRDIGETLDTGVRLKPDPALPDSYDFASAQSSPVPMSTASGGSSG